MALKQLDHVADGLGAAEIDDALVPVAVGDGDAAQADASPPLRSAELGVGGQGWD